MLDKLARTVVYSFSARTIVLTHPLRRTPMATAPQLDLYVIRRRNGWQTPGSLQEAAARSKHVGDDLMSDDIRWIRSYVVKEHDGSLGTVCIYQASSPEK